MRDTEATNMRKLPNLARQITCFLPAILIAFAAGLILNAYYQARAHFEFLSPRGRIAVFIGKKAQVSHQLIAEKILNIEGVAGAVYVSQDKALETALKDAPALKEVMVTGDNPFSPYFLVEPREATPGVAQWLKEQVAAVEGVVDIRYDANTFTILDSLRSLTRIYGTAIKALAAFGFIFAVFRYALNRMYRLIDYRHFLFLLLGGAAAGSLGAGAYYAMARFTVQATMARVPDHYAVYMALAGVLSVMAWEN